MSHTTYYHRFVSPNSRGPVRRLHGQSAGSYRRALRFEPLEDRRLLSVTWIEQGPGPILDGQCDAAPDNLVVGAVEALVADPSNPNVVYAGTVAGGVWKTTNFLQVGGQPNWAPLTDQYPSLAIGALALSPLDPSHNTLFVGTGDFISGGPNGRAVGVYRTTDGGATWQQLGQSTLKEHHIRSIVPTGLGGDLQHQVVLVATVDSGGIFRSNDGGVTFVLISDSDGTGDGLDNDADGSIDEVGEKNLPGGNASHLVGDPGNASRFFAAVPGQGIFRSADGGQRWTKVSNVIPGIASSTRIEISVSAAAGNTVYAALIGPTNQLQGVFFSADHGTNWTALGSAPNVNPGGQGDDHFSILADPTHPNLVYIGGDRNDEQPFVGRLVRGDTSTQIWTALSDTSNTDGTAPHADSRDMIFVSTGIIEADDGGIYHLSNPAGEESIWTSKNGNLRVTEFFSAAYDHLSNRIIGGTQDTGVPQQASTGSFAWNEYTQGDGGTVDIGYFTFNDDPYSIRYSMANNFHTFRRQVFEADGDESLLNWFYGGQADLNGLNPIDAEFDGFDVFPFELNRFDPSQVVIGGNQLYESADWADNLTILDTGGRTAIKALAYGGMLAGVPNSSVLYAGLAGALLLRSASGTLLSTTNYTAPQRGTPQDIVMDPDDWRRVYVTDGTSVYRSTDAGLTWTTIASVQNGGNLAGFTDELYCIELYSPTTTSGDEVVMVGGRNGVFRTFDPNAGLASTWFELGWNLPNAPVSDLRYDATDDVLLAATHGRGAWTIPQASQVLPINYDLRGTLCDVPDKVAWGDTFTLTGRVANDGGAPLNGNFVQRFYLSNDLTWGGIDDEFLGLYLHTAPVPAEGVASTFTVDLTLPSQAPFGYTDPGPFYIGMVTDADGYILETNETNNLPPASGLLLDYDNFTIPPTADLRGWSCLAPTTINWGESFIILGQVHNSGLLPVTTDFRQQFFLGPDAIWGDGDEIYLGQYLHTGDMPGPGVGSTFLATLTLPTAPPTGFAGAGPFYIGMTTDALNQVAETNEPNNYPGSLGLGFDYDSFNLPGYYDLGGGQVNAPSSIGWGQSFTLTGRVRNDGTLPVTTDFRQQFFLGADEIWGNGEERFLSEYVHANDVSANSLGAEFQVTMSLPSTPPPGFSGNGPFYIGMTTDTRNDVAETNEANNFPGAFGWLYDYDSFSLLSNDYFAYRVDLGSAVSIADGGSNQGFSSEPGEPVVDLRIEPVTSAWWSWTAPADGTLTVNTFFSNFDTWLSIWTGSAVNGLSLVAENDDFNGAQSQVVVDVSVDTQYQIAVDGYQAATGNIVLNASFTNNDNFAYRTDLGAVSSVTDSGSNRGFTGQTGEVVQSGTLNSAWWTWTAPTTGVLVIDTFGSSFDTFLTLATGSAVEALTVLAQNDDSGGLQSRLSRVVAAGTQYQIAVDGYQANTGDITLNLSFTNNDNFANRISLGSVSSVTNLGSNVGYTGERHEVAQSSPLNSAWWMWTAPSDGILTVDTFGSSFDTFLTLATGNAVDDLRVIARNDDYSGLQSRVREVVAAGTQYQIAVDGYQALTGDIALNLLFTIGVPNLTPYQPVGWSNKIVVSKVPGTNSDDGSLTSTDVLYVDWSGINAGTAGTGAACITELYLDGVLHSSFNLPALNPSTDYRLTDYVLGSLSAGTHTLRIVVDSANVVQESFESDNIYERAFLVSEGLGSITVIKDSIPNEPQPFRYSGTLGVFLLDDDVASLLPSDRTFAALAPGAYVITEDPWTGWTLPNLTVAGDLDNGSTVDLVHRTVTLDVDPGENISVTFVNRRLAGDYSHNGIVDAADYVVWRDTLGQVVAPYAGADGDSDGTVDSDDYGVWRANFGNTLLAPGSASTALTSTPSAPSISDVLTAPAESVGPAATTLAEPFDDAVQFDSAVPSYFPPTVIVVQRDRSRSKDPRLGKRDLLVVAASHDQALVAWLAARATGPRRDLSDASFHGLPNELDSPDSPGQLENTLDMAFESLAV